MWQLEYKMIELGITTEVIIARRTWCMSVSEQAAALHYSK